MGWTRILSGPIADGEAASAPRWWFRLFKPLQTAFDDITSDADTWNVATLAGTWANHGIGWPTAAYRRVRGVVYLRGLVGAGTGTILTLPVGYRPVLREIFVTVCDAGGGAVGACRIDVNTDGTVVQSTFSLSGTNSFISLSNIRFFAEG